MRLGNMHYFFVSSLTLSNCSLCAIYNNDSIIFVIDVGRFEQDCRKPHSHCDAHFTQTSHYLSHYHTTSHLHKVRLVCL